MDSAQLDFTDFTKFLGRNALTSIQQQQQQQSLLSQARWGRLEMKPRMKTSELNPKENRGNKGKGEPKTTKRGNT
jgi:hypothetical protein